MRSLFAGRRIPRKTPDQLALMREAGLVVARTLEAVRDTVRPGVSTAELDVLAEENIRRVGAVPSFKGYQGFPSSICVSVNHEVVHGIPGGVRLADGDLVSVDCGAIVDGWHGDAAISVPVGEVTPELTELSRVCEESLWRGLAAVRPDGRLSDVSAAVESYVRSQGNYGIVREYTGHGIGDQMHMDPDVPNHGRPGRGPRLLPGIAIAVEPMITLGRRETEVLDDEWTVITRDGSVAAHFEHTVTLTPDGPWVLTALDGGAVKFAELGVSCGAPEPTSGP